MKVLMFTFLLSAALFSCNDISIEDATYQDRPHFKIETTTATYFFDKSGGGMSRIIDRDGVDWVQHRGGPHDTGRAAGFARGVPNLVYRSDDAGAGHAGFDQCISEQAGARTIRSRSKSGKWEWTWVFFDDHARFTIEKVDPDHAYWFLYEGPVAGSFDPSRKYWGTDLGGPRYESPSLNKQENVTGKWQWAYFGDKETDRVFYVHQQQKDSLIDYFAYMGNTRDGNLAPDGLVVFGFGREIGAKPIMTQTEVTFRVGFLERKIATAEDHEWAGKQIMNRAD